MEKTNPPKQAQTRAPVPPEAPVAPKKAPAPPKAPSLEEISKRSAKSMLIKMIFINSINVILVITTFYFLGRLPQKANRIQKQKGESLASVTQTDIDIQKAEVSKNGTKIERLENLFVDESSILAFVAQIDSLKSQNLVTEFSFMTNNPVQDNTGNSGIPVLIVYKGSINQINSSLTEIDKLDLMLRPIGVELIKESDNSYTYNYGAFIYFKEESRL